MIAKKNTREAKLYKNADENPQKAILQEKLKGWLESNTLGGHKADRQSQVTAVPICVQNARVLNQKADSIGDQHIMCFL